MNLVIGVIFLWFGGALVYVATHGITGGLGTPMDAWNQILANISGQSNG